MCSLHEVNGCTTTLFLLGLLLPNRKNDWNKWKNHFYEISAEIGMSCHEKGRQQEQKVIHNPIPTSFEPQQKSYAKIVRGERGPEASFFRDLGVFFPENILLKQTGQTVY